ncbi:MAG: hypothetical protein V4550_04035 [Gemmatimonadota bacterium]
MLFLFFSTAAGAQPAPYHRYYTLDTRHFHVHVPAGLEREGRVAGAYAERAYELLARELAPPRGMIELVVSDDADYSNGFATPLPSNRIVVFATPPVESPSLRLNADWLEIVITHELTHIFHLDRARGLPGFAQHIFGRAPSLFPNLQGPSWLTEGLAVYYESRLTAGGRLNSSEHRMLARAAAIENKLPRLGDLSLSSPLFPGGERAYGYGSLLVEYIARTHGDTGVAKLIDAQSGLLIPYRLNHVAQKAFGVDFSTAFDAWSDSVRASVRQGSPNMTYTEWRELTKHPYYATDPRWINDSVLVYAGNDGRSTQAAYSLRLDGGRERLGRRNSLGASVPLPDGSFIFSQLELVSPSEVRSDLYVEKNGKQHRITKGMRLVQPDARRDGTIIAVQLAPTRASLLLIDSTFTHHRLLRDAGPDETWSEPRWSPDGRYVAAIHRVHGGEFTLEVIDIQTNAADVLDVSRAILAAPSWAPSGGSVVYTSEASGVPTLTVVRRDLMQRRQGDQGGGTGAYAGEIAPSAQVIAGVHLRADGFHVGVMPASSAATGAVSPLSEAKGLQLAQAQDSQPLAAGDYRKYSAWGTVLPTYWHPLIEAAPNRGTRLGFETSGHDAIYRHLWDGFLAVPTTGSYPTGRFTYRYAGFRKPYIDLQLSQDYTSDFTFQNGGTGEILGALLRRSQNASLGATFVRPRVRTYSSFSFGGNLERRSFRADPGEFLKQLDTAYARDYNFPSAFLSGSWSNTQRPSLSISAEDGVSLSFTVRERARADIAKNTRSTSVVGATSMYKSLDLPGFAHHVLALRVAGGIADRRAASSFQVGGVSSGTIQFASNYTLGEGRRTFGVRGFSPASVFGTRAASGTLEYRAPLSLGGRGFGMLPLFYDRAFFTAFADAGVATCAENPLVPTVCAPSPRIGRTIASAGGEFILSASVLDWDTPQSIRLGFAVPVAGRAVTGASRVSVYLAYGLSF